MSRRKQKQATPTLDEALQRWHDALKHHALLAPLSVERIPLSRAYNRILATPIWARISSPHYHAAAMDGYAVRAERTVGAHRLAPAKLLLSDDAIPVDTGDPLPPAMNAVIKIEDTRRLDTEWIEILAEVALWQHVRAVGEDIVSSQLILSAPHPIQPQDLGAIAGAGHAEVDVYRQPRVAIQPTGTELVAPGTTALKAGDIIEYNSLVLAAQVQQAGCIASTLPVIPDDFAAIKRAATEALANFDLVIINAGSSAGSEDFTASIVEELGELAVHGIAIRPGHPVVLGVAAGKALVGLPGYPVAAATTFDRIVRPLLYLWQGIAPPKRPEVTATLTNAIRSSNTVDHFARVALGRVGERFIASPIEGGSGAIMSLVEADGIVTIPHGVAKVDAAESMRVELLRPPEEIEQTILCAGLDDPALSILADQLRKGTPSRRLCLTQTGGKSCLQALRAGEVHLAAVSDLSDQGSLQCLAYVNREVGLLVQPGNPQRISEIDLQQRADLIFAASEDSRPKACHPARIEKSQLAMAAAIQSGLADYGIGARSVATALGLDFISLRMETVYLVMSQELDSAALLAPLIALVVERNQQLSGAIDALEGYDTSIMGENKEKIYE